MKKNILARTNLLICLIIIVGFFLTAALGYRANYNSSLKSIEQVSDLTSEGIYYQLTSTFTKPVNISLTMANDSLLREFLEGEKEHFGDGDYIQKMTEYLATYRNKYQYDSVFLASDATGRYYNFNGLDRTLTPDNPENSWYYDLLEDQADYTVVVDNDEVAGAGNEITVFVNCKIKGEGGQVLGIVGVGMRIQDLQSLLQSYKSEFDVNAYLVDDEGMIEISPEHTGYEKVSLFSQQSYRTDVERAILDWTGEKEAKSLWTSGTKGDNYLVTRYIPELGWHLVTERNTGALVEQMKLQVALSLGIIMLIVILILLIVTWVIRSFNRRIVALTQSVEQEKHTLFEKATEQLYENIYKLDITHNRPANRVTEEYFESLGAPPDIPFDKALHIIAERQIKEEFRQGYLDTFKPENVLRAFEEGRETLRYEFLISQDQKNYYWMRITARLLRWESDGSVHMLVYRQNIDAEKRQELRIQRLAQTDEMTGFLNKSATQRRVGELLEQFPGQMYAFFILDIDRFKQANDQFGHAFGDNVIREFTQAIRGCFDQDSVLGRVGGDEFVAFVPVSREERAVEKGRELSETLHKTYSAGSKTWELSASIGAALTPRDGTSFDAVFRHADKALYSAKRKGRDTFVFYRETES